MKKPLSSLFIILSAVVNLSAHQSDIDLLPGRLCTSFCLNNNGYAIFGANYDYVKDRHDGLIFVNKRNVSKSAQESGSSDTHVRWTAKYGSVSFNLIASQCPWAGMNEAGLVINLARLEGSKEPEPDKRAWIHSYYWLQYMLDNFSTVEEVIASDSSMRIVSTGRIPHYLVSDKHGNCATIEFIKGKMVVHSEENLPVKVLANTSYDGSIMELHEYLMKKNKGQSLPLMGTSSRDRFIRSAEQVTAFKPTDSETAVKTAYDILEEASGQKIGGPTPCWSIVFDTKNLQIHFKTIVHSNIRMIDLQKLDFSCQSPVKMLDINEKLSGDITNHLKDYTFEQHYSHAVMAGKKWGLGLSPEELKEQIHFFEEFPCK